MTKKKRYTVIIIIFAVALCGLIAMGPIMSNVEIPNYNIVRSDGAIEIRQYQPMIIAEVSVQGEREVSIGDGFRLLADYIFGNNVVSQEIAMTAPVEQQSTKIAMTAPVEQQASGDSWNVRFVMPAEYSMESLPKPVNDKVNLRQVPAKKFVAITFSGTNSKSNLATHQQELLAYVNDNNLTVTGQPKYAFYNPPWTLPPMRRNEVMWELQ